MELVACRLMRKIVSLWSEVIDVEIIEPEVETNNCYVMDGWIPAHDPMFHVRFEVAWEVAPVTSIWPIRHPRWQRAWHRSETPPPETFRIAHGVALRQA